MQKPKRLYKFLQVLFVSIVFLLVLSACEDSKEEIWYRISYGAAQSNTILISKKTDKGFQLEADCVNGANLGKFNEEFIFVSDSKAVYSGRTNNGTEYKIFAIFNNENMTIEFNCNYMISEWDALGFGNTVTISGEYSPKKPEYDYSDLVLKKVFLSDSALAENVKEFLGEKEYKTFIYDFGMSNYIYETERNGYRVIKGTLKGIGNWCAFCSDDNGFFYGIYNDVYFTNDPIYKDTKPDFLKLN